MKSKIFDHWGLKLLSLVIAILIWVIVANVDDYKTTKLITGIPVEFVNGDAITEKNKVYELPENLTLNIVIKGRRKVVENLSNVDFLATADLSKMSITNAVKIKVSPISSYLLRDITISYTEDSVIVGVEDKTEKQLPITVRSISRVANGYAIRNKIAAPNLITISGAKSVIDTINEVVVDVDVKNAKHTLSAYAEPIFLDHNGMAIDADKVEYDVKKVDVMVEILKTKSLAVKVKTKGKLKEGYAVSHIDYQPTKILVVGEASDLARVDEILIDNIDVDGCKKDVETSVMIADYLPTGIVLAEELEEVMIKVMIEKIEEKTVLLEKDNINIVGKQDGYTYTFEDEEPYNIKLSGMKEDLDKIKITNLIPSIDVRDYAPGIYKIQVDLRENSKVDVVESCTVTLKIEAIE